MYRLAQLALALAVMLDAVLVFGEITEVEFQTQISLSSAIERGGELQKNELSIEPRIDVRFTSGARLTGRVMVRSDFADNLEPGEPTNDFRSAASSRWTPGDYLDVELRELFLDFDVGETLVRLGKQQVVWGQADGLRILDVINPLSYREFILPDFEDRRIPLWMMNAEFPVAGATLQFLWIPDQTYDEFPDSEGSYTFTAPRFRPALNEQEPAQLQSLQMPNSVLKDSDIGLRLSAFTGGWDLTANYLYHYQDQPVLELDRSGAVIQVIPTYKRTHLAGVSASTAFGNFVFRGELGYSTDRYFTSYGSADGFEKSHEVSGVLGLDYSGLTDTLISGQFFQSSVGGSDGMLRPTHERSVSLLVRRDFANDTLSAEILAIHNTNDSDGVVQLELSYQLTSNMTLAAGADVFYGTADGLFGQFDERDRFTLHFEISL